MNLKITFRKDVILDFLKTNKLSQKKFADQCCISVYNLKKILNNDPTFRCSVLLAVAREMNVKLSTIVIEDNFVDDKK